MIQEKPPLPNSDYQNGLENDLNDLKMTLKRQKLIWDEGNADRKSENPDEIIAVHLKSKPTTPRMHETEIKRILTTPSRGKFIIIIWPQMTVNDLKGHKNDQGHWTWSQEHGAGQLWEGVRPEV